MIQRAIAIVGAGLAGAAAAQRLHEAGVRTAIFDKGRGIGGRMATRRGTPEDGGRSFAFDHGAQYFTARAQPFREAVERWCRDEIVAPWGEPGWFVACPTMPALCRALIGPVATHAGTTVTRLLRDPAGWRLEVDDGATVTDPWDAVLLTCPAPQTAALLATADLAWPDVDAVRYDPCWALIFAHAGPPLFEAQYRRGTDAEPALAWIARDATKPGRAGGVETLVVHASTQWSRTHLELPAADACRLLLETMGRVFPALPASGVPLFSAAHRWRYARVAVAAGKPCLWSAADSLGAAGDWCIEGRVEAAYLSGIALAERALER